MADETPQNPIDAELDPAKVEAELAAARAAKPEQEKPPEGTGDILPQEMAQEEPVAAKPAEETPAAKPEKTPEEVQREGTLRRLLREREKELAETRRQLAERETPPVREVTPDPRKEPTYEEDPAEYLKRRLDNTENELRQARAEQQMKERFDLIRSQEAEFERSHPDYRDALKKLEESEVEDWESTGAARFQTMRLAEAVKAGRDGNPQGRPYAQHIDRIAQTDAAQKIADERNWSVEDAAIYLTARDTYMNQRRELVRQGAEAIGKNPAEIAYDRARRRGYIPSNGTDAKAEAEAAERAKVERARQVSAASDSLSEIGTAEGSETPKVIRNRSQVINLSDDELDQIISKGSYREL